MSDEIKKVALPAYLLKRLESFRVARGNDVSYVLRDKLKSKTYDLDAWQFFVLEVLPGCEDYPKLLSVFEDRFGRTATEDQLRSFLGSLADGGLFDMDTADKHPLLKPMMKTGYTVEDGVAKPKPAAELAAAPDGAAASKPVATPAAASPPPDAEVLPPGIEEAVGFDPRATRVLVKLFDPRQMMNTLMPVVRPLRHLSYLAPLLLVSAVLIAFEYFGVLVQDLERLSAETSFAQHLLFSLVTVNLVNTLMTAFMAHRYRATVDSIGIGLVFGFVPRLMTHMSHTQQLARDERMWLHGAPLLLRTMALSLGLLMWFNSRESAPILAEIGLGLAVVSGFGLLLSANPLVRSSAYHLLSAFLNEPKLRGKAYRALLDKWSGKTYRHSDNNLLAAYALLTFAFMFAVVVIALLLLGRWLHDLQVGGIAVVLVLGLGFFLFRRTWSRLKKIDQAYQASLQFDRWRKRAVPEEMADPDREREVRGPIWRYLRVALPILVLVGLFIPYVYEPGGDFSVYPAQQLQVSTDEAGLIKEVFFDGGEFVKKGTPLARLANDDLIAQVKTLDAKLLEQQAHIADLKARPKPEAVKVAVVALETARNASVFSKARVRRLTTLVKDGAVSQEEYEAARQQAQRDADAVVQRQADLALAKLGATPEQIVAAEAQLASLTEQRSAYVSRIERTTLYMPIDGNILSLHLKKRTNSFLDKGQPFAAVEDPSLMSAEIEVPEGDARFVAVGAKVELRASAYFDRPFEGKVSLIDRNVTVKPFGNVLKVIVLVKNPDGLLRTGMRGYAKIDGTSMASWRAFTMSVTRFFQVHVWSWMP